MLLQTGKQANRQTGKQANRQSNKKSKTSDTKKAPINISAFLVVIYCKFTTILH
jgi:hypothetical protein